MGYRVRLGKISKDTDLRNKPADYWGEGEDRTEYPWKPTEHTQLYEIGKGVSLSEGFEDFYTEFNIFKEEESEFCIVSKEQMKGIIDWYHQETREYFDSLVGGDDEKRFNHCTSMLKEWRSDFGLKPYYLDETKTDGEIVSSWKMQYAIFNLVYIYRTFDWENDYLIYSGW